LIEFATRIDLGVTGFAAIMSKLTHPFLTPK